MSDELSPELRRELFDDFYSECDELLTALRTDLALLEAASLAKKTDLKTVEGLFRNTHSLKGISAIVGLRPAELVAHAMEDLLRGLSKNQFPVTSEMIEALMSATRRVEKIVTAQRQEKTLPDPAAVLAQLAKVVPSSAKLQSAPNAAAVTPDIAPPTVVAPESAATESTTLKRFLVIFQPSKELEQRGVNVTAVRERLKKLGEIYSAIPTVKAGGIEFHFTVGMVKIPDEANAWAADNIRIVAVEETVSLPEKVKTPSVEDQLDEALSLAPSHLVRVDLARLDELMRIAGEMVIHRSRLEDRVQAAELSREGLKEVSVALGRSMRELREAITRVRMVPIAEIFARIPFIVRDLKRDSDKQVRVFTEGNQTEVDKYLVERLKEPLLHLVRNAFAHGIEPAATRTAAGKPAEATITLRAKSAGESVIIQIRDDGRGIDPEKIISRARATGLRVVDHPTAAELLQVLCSPGFSTQEEADRAAGRGVGMAVVATTVQALGGTLSLESWPEKGTEFTLKLPLTLSIADAIIVAVNGELCAVPQSAVTELVQVPTTDVRTIQNAEVIPYRGGLLPIVRLRTLFGAPSHSAAQLTLLVIASERGETGLVVDEIRAQREIVIRALSDPLLRVPGVSGATELGDGRPILILDPSAITQRLVRPKNNADSRSRPGLVTPQP